MSRSLFEPDFSSTTTFPRSSFIPSNEIPASQQLHSSSPLSPPKKQTRFCASKENTEYWIQRRDSQKLSVRTEAVLNRIALTQEQIREEYEEFERLGSELNDRLRESLAAERLHPELVDVLDAKEIISALKAQSQRLEERIEFMRIDTLRLKSGTLQMLDLAKHELREPQVSTANQWSVLSRSRLEVFESLWIPATATSYRGESILTQISPLEATEPTARCA